MKVWQEEAAGLGRVYSVWEVSKGADPQLRSYQAWRWLRRAVVLHRPDMQNVLSHRQAAAHTGAQAVTSPTSLACSCSLIWGGQGSSSLALAGTPEKHSLAAQVTQPWGFPLALQDLGVFLQSSGHSLVVGSSSPKQCLLSFPQI